jgi:Mycothiol maleylpyruvate isomerase N-terminal domain
VTVVPASIGAADAFLEAARHAGRVLCDPAIGEDWHRPSVLSRMDVGSVAGHVYLVVRRVNKHLDAQRTLTGAVDPGTPDRPVPKQTVIVEVPARHLPTIRVADEDDLDADLHVQVRRDGERIAERGWSSVVSSYAALVEVLAARLADPPDVIVPLGGSSPVLFAPYLASRVAELLVHADDLAVSVGLDVSPPSVNAVSVALTFLVESARAMHGDVAVLRAFARRERTPPGIPSVY